MDSTGTGAHSTYDYVIVGAGVAAASAAKAIREHDADGTLAILGREPDGPYYRPDLSKTLWLDGEAQLDNGWLLDGEAGTGSQDGADVRTGASVTAIDTSAKTLTLADTSTVGYQYLRAGDGLAAAGARPARIRHRIIHFRTVEDCRVPARPALAAVLSSWAAGTSARRSPPHWRRTTCR